MKIQVEVITVIEFSNVCDFLEYVESDEVARLTGFANEIAEAYEKRTPITVTTPRSQYGAVTKSTLEVREVLK